MRMILSFISVEKITGLRTVPTKYKGVLAILGPGEKK